MPTGNGSLVAPSTMPITLVVAHVDSDSLFHDYTQVCKPAGAQILGCSYTPRGKKLINCDLQP